MNADAKILATAGAVCAFLAVALGAFGAHTLRERLSPDMLAVYRTAVEYQFWHALGLIAAGIVLQMFPDTSLLKWSGWAMLAGILLFSGSLYALAMTEIRVLGAITPIGGLCFLLAWVLLAAGLVKS
jgi:uncharacterized membrane protein YgdD (TMEM256/DUF423 family)